MVLKTLKASKGVSLLELILTITIIALLLGFVYIKLNPADLRANARDEVRISDMQTLDRAINEYLLDNEAFPGISATTLVSTVVPSGSASPVENALGGWIGQNLTTYISSLPTDPINDVTYFYTYRYSGSSYEINMILENASATMQNDGGNDIDIYEVGNDLSVL